MSEVERDEKRTYRITMEATVDAYGAEEQAMGWYYYLDNKIQFPFQARCIQERHISQLKVGEVVQVEQMSSEDECMREMFVEVEWQDRTFSVPLVQLQAIKVAAETKEVIEDWHYWVARGHEF